MKRIICIDGNISAGKTRLLSGLNTPHPTLFEPVDRWTMLEQFYQNKMNAGYCFELEVNCTRLTQLFQTLPKHNTIIFERDPILQAIVFGQLSVEEGKLSPQQFDNLRTCVESVNGVLDHVEWINVFLECPTEVCLDRIKTRSRKGEELITASYLDKVDRLYRETLPSTTIFVDSNRSPEKVIHDVEKIINS